MEATNELGRVTEDVLRAGREERLIDILRKINGESE